ncbi:MAG TPA: hypothetical protein VNL71_18575, partial [Chloroflexota bacterium]|nr:hypothetical protein [Chloroflexota bacterium]
MKIAIPRFIAALSIFLAGSLSLLGAGPARAAMNVVTAKANAGLYALTLNIGPTEHMYTMQQVKSKHVKAGEVMVSGVMVMGGSGGMGGMSGPMPNHHLEVHVLQRSTGKTITKAMVSITILTSAGKLVERLPIAVMYGIAAGPKDTHFGNNVALKNGKYKIVVQVNQAKTMFMVTLGAAPMSM